MPASKSSCLFSVVIHLDSLRRIMNRDSDVAYEAESEYEDALRLLEKLGFVVSCDEDGNHSIDPGCWA